MFSYHGMAARKLPEPGVYPYFALIDGRKAFVTIDWHGVESEPYPVGEFETEAEVIEYLADALWAVRPRGTRRAKDLDRAALRVLRLL